MLNYNFLILLEEITQKDLRKEASKKMAQILGSEDIAFFLKDPEVDLYFSVAGYPQLLTSREEWQSFLRECSETHRSERSLPWPDTSVKKSSEDRVIGYSAQGIETILVLLGRPRSSEMLAQLIKLLPLLASCFRFEWLAISTRNSMSIHAHERKKIELLMLHLEKTRLDLQNSLSHSQKALSARNDFLSIASHELKTPLQSILLEVGMLKRVVSKSDTSDLTAKIYGRLDSLGLHLKHMTTLVDNLLDYSQVVHGKINFNFEYVDLSAMAREVILRLHRLAQDAGCSLHLNATGPAFAYCDVTRMDQVLSNLVVNAIKYSPSKDIYIGVSLSEEGPVFFVKDQGIGISANDQKKIFERFERCSSAKDISGFGLGLFVVKQIIDGHGGRIDVHSELQNGSTFTVFLPKTLQVLETSHE